MVKDLEIFLVGVVILYSILLLYTIFYKGKNSKNLKTFTTIGGCLTFLLIIVITIVIALLIGLGQCSFSTNH